MKELAITRYTPDMMSRWNDFVANSRNGTFLFNRSFMDYHSDRFDDYSLVAHKGGRIVAVLPAEREGDVLSSHRGLTYGGWVLPRKHVDCIDVMSLWSLWLDYCRDNGITTIDYKPMPHIYASMPSDEDEYALWRCGAQLVEVNVSATIALSDNSGENEMRRRHLRSAAGGNLVVKQLTNDEDFARYYDVLSACLADRHDAKPVHSSDELLLLAHRFAAKSDDKVGDISLWAAQGVDGSIDAGVIIFNTPRVVHCQYIATSPRGRDNHALTLLIHTLIAKATDGTFGEGKRFFDFGTSNEGHGTVLNAGLYRQKASFGASAAVYRRWQITL